MKVNVNMETIHFPLSNTKNTKVSICNENISVSSREKLNIERHVEYLCKRGRQDVSDLRKIRSLVNFE